MREKILVEKDRKEGEKERKAHKERNIKNENF